MWSCRPRGLGRGRPGKDGSDGLQGGSASRLAPARLVGTRGCAGRLLLGTYAARVPKRRPAHRLQGRDDRRPRARQEQHQPGPPVPRPQASRRPPDRGKNRARRGSGVEIDRQCWRRERTRRAGTQQEGVPGPAHQGARRHRGVVQRQPSASTRQCSSHRRRDLHQPTSPGRLRRERPADRERCRHVADEDQRRRLGDRRRQLGQYAAGVAQYPTPGALGTIGRSGQATGSVADQRTEGSRLRHPANRAGEARLRRQVDRSVGRQSPLHADPGWFGCWAGGGDRNHPARRGAGPELADRACHRGGLRPPRGGGDSRPRSATTVAAAHRN